MPTEGEVLVHEFATRVIDADGVPWIARAYGRRRADHWIGWLVFIGEDGRRITTHRETTQPDRRALDYWASGVEPIYLDGALTRALEPLSLFH